MNKRKKIQISQAMKSRYKMAKQFTRKKSDKKSKGA